MGGTTGILANCQGGATTSIQGPPSWQINVINHKTYQSKSSLDVQPLGAPPRSAIVYASRVDRDTHHHRSGCRGPIFGQIEYSRTPDSNPRVRSHCHHAYEATRLAHSGNRGAAAIRARTAIVATREERSMNALGGKGFSPES